MVQVENLNKRLRGILESTRGGSRFVLDFIVNSNRRRKKNSGNFFILIQYFYVGLL